MEYRVVSEHPPMELLEALFQAIFQGTLVVFALAVGVMACLCLFDCRLLKRPAHSKHARPVRSQASPRECPSGEGPQAAEHSLLVLLLIAALVGCALPALASPGESRLRSALTHIPGQERSRGAYPPQLEDLRIGGRGDLEKARYLLRSLYAAFSRAAAGAVGRQAPDEVTRFPVTHLEMRIQYGPQQSYALRLIVAGRSLPLE
jgi:hypothetical protein